MGPPITALSYDTPAVYVQLDLSFNQADFGSLFIVSEFCTRFQHMHQNYDKSHLLIYVLVLNKWPSRLFNAQNIVIIGYIACAFKGNNGK